MKLKDLFEKQKVIEGDVNVPHFTKKLNYDGVIVKGDFNAANTDIPSLKGSPSWVGGVFSCYGTKITSLEGISEYIGADLNCFFTPIESFQNIHKQIKHIGGQLYLPKLIKSHILGVIFIKGLESIAIIDGNSKQTQVQNIINNHLAGDRNPHEVQGELIEAGFSEYAKL